MYGGTMLTLDQFITKNLNKFVNYDKAYGYQCTDCMREYIIECMGINPYSAIPATNYAKNMFYNYPTISKFFTKVKNTPTGIPPKGAIIFWGTYPFVTGFAGHVAIVTSSNINNFISFDQNYPKNSPCKLVKHSYKGVLGWLVKKV
jgi:hypothetical protein